MPRNPHIEIAYLQQEAFSKLAAKASPMIDQPASPRTCRVCGCTDDDCSGCIERTGRSCSWVEADLCSACDHTS